MKMKFLWRLGGRPSFGGDLSTADNRVYFIIFPIVRDRTLFSFTHACLAFCLGVRLQRQTCVFIGAMEDGRYRVEVGAIPDQWGGGGEGGFGFYRCAALSKIYTK